MIHAAVQALAVGVQTVAAHAVTVKAFDDQVQSSFVSFVRSYFSENVTCYRSLGNQDFGTMGHQDWDTGTPAKWVGCGCPTTVTVL